jgi:FemAB-related protein (PEP-CTERM system-associated)
LTTCELDNLSPAAWSSFVRDHPDGTFFHQYEWLQLVREVYGGEPYYLAAYEEGRLVGVLPLMLRRVIGAGRILISVPFADVGGVCTAHPAADQVLLEAAHDLGARLKVAYVELRQARRLDVDAPTDQTRLALEVPLSSDPEEMWRQLPRTAIRQPINRARRRGLTARTEQSPEALAQCHAIYCEATRDLGSPMHGEAFFQQIAALTAPDCYQVLVCLDEKPVGAAVAWIHRGRLMLASAMCLRRHFALNPNDLLYWALVNLGIRQGCSVLDLGRSPRGSGNYEFKKRWGAQETQLVYTFLPVRKQPRLGERREGAAYRLLSRLWPHVPMPVARAIGPRLFARIPI